MELGKVHSRSWKGGDKMIEQTLISWQISWQELPQSFKKLLKEAEKAMERAYCPYSGFSVGAAVLTKSEEIITSCNLESAAYGDSICAEDSAVASANAQGYGTQLRAIAVIARKEDSPIREVAVPCGSSLQVLSEAAYRADYDLEVILSTTLKDKIVLIRISELLPFPFGPRDLEMGGGEGPAGLAGLAKSAS